MLFTLRPPSKDSWDHAQIVAQSLASGERIVLIERGRDARYIPTGHLVYGLNGVLLGVPFDVRARRVTGPAVPLVEGVMDADVRTGAMHFTVSNDGTLVYLSGGSGERSTLSWVNRERPSRPAAGSGAALFISPRVARRNARCRGSRRSRWCRYSHLRFDPQHADQVDAELFAGTISVMDTRQPARRLLLRLDGGGLYSAAADGTGSLTRLTTTREMQTP